MSVESDATKFISEAPGKGRIGIVYHGDADGVAGAVIVRRCLERLGAAAIETVPLGRGLNPHSAQVGERLAGLDLSRLIVIDSGSRGGTILAGVPTLVIDHHRLFGHPQVDVFFNTATEDPVRPTSLAVYDICKHVVDISDLDWVAAIGVVGDLGPRAPFAIVEECFKKYGRKNITDSVVLVNAGQRYKVDRMDLAFDVLVHATSPAEIAKHQSAGSVELERMRKEVQDEL